MTEFLQNFFSSVFSDNVILATILISMIPIIELRGGIPFGMAKHIWGENALNFFDSTLFAFLGSSVIVFVLAPIIKPLINLLKKTKGFKKLATWFETRIQGKSQKIEDSAASENKKSKWKKIFGVFVFVAIPLPLTGVWTGTCIAAFLGLSYLETCATVITGNLCAGLITMVVSLIFKENTIYVMYVFLLVALALITYGITKALAKAHKNKQTENTQNEQQD